MDLDSLASKCFTDVSFILFGYRFFSPVPLAQKISYMFQDNRFFFLAFMGPTFGYPSLKRVEYIVDIGVPLAQELTAEFTAKFRAVE